jgi:hypothetical protein
VRLDTEHITVERECRVEVADGYTDMGYASAVQHRSLQFFAGPTTSQENN